MALLIARASSATGTAAWDFGDGSGGSGDMPSHSYTKTGIYDICLIVNDGTEDSAQACIIAVVYDPSGGFVTGGGWITSPAGAYTADPSLTGKANFGFVAKYKKGSPVPTGNTVFAFDLAGFEFHSESYEWLVVNQGGENAQFKGSGLVNDGLDPNGNLYKFMVWAGDSSPDTFRIKIWWEDSSGEHVVYGNGTNQAIGGGNIMVHKGK
jgi:PKD repeat protein